MVTAAAVSRFSTSNDRKRLSLESVALSEGVVPRREDVNRPADRRDGS